MQRRSDIIRQAKFIEFYLAYVWPLHRLFVKHKLSKRCSHCALSAVHTPLTDGVCVLCSSAKESGPTHDALYQQKMEQELHEIFLSAQKSGRKRYDMLVLFSGGKDSSYLLDKLLTTYKDLRILALTVDNTFMSPVALENATWIIEKLGVDHMVFRVSPKMMEKMFGYAFKHIGPDGAAATVDQFDGDFFSDVGRNMACQLEIPYLILGLSRSQVEKVLGLKNFESPREFEKSKRTSVAKIPLTDIFDDEEMKQWWDGTLHPDPTIPRVLFPNYVWNLDEEFIKKEVIRRGLIRKGLESPLVTNNELIMPMIIVDYKRFGFSSFESEFSRMIREKRANYKEWRNTFEYLEYVVKNDLCWTPGIRKLLTRLSLTQKDLS